MSWHGRDVRRWLHAGLRPRTLLVLVLVLAAVAALAAAAVSRRSNEAEAVLVAQTADSAERATEGGSIEKPEAEHGEADRSVVKKTLLTHPAELTLTRAGSKVFDVRTLKSVVVKKERPEHEGRGAVETGEDEDAEQGEPGGKADADKADAGKADAGKADPDKADADQADPDQNDSDKADADKAESPAETLPAKVSQSTIAAASASTVAADSSFEGLDFATWGQGHPPDTNGDVGPNYYIQTINVSIGIYAKSTGTRVAAFTFNSFMSQGNFGNLCDTDNFGDPVVLYDSFEDRWVITDFAFKLDGSGNVSPQHVYECFAVSKTADPVNGGWNYYSIETPGGLGDYPKFGVWPDGIYMSANMFGYSAGGSYFGYHVWALNKAQMYAGEPKVSVVDFAGGTDDFALLPANARLQSGAPPVGTPEYFVSTEQFLNAVSIYKFHVDWDKISTSTFTGPTTAAAPTCWPNSAVANASTPANAADTLSIRAMAQNQYSNIGGAESLWVDHTVNRGEFTIAACGGTNANNATIRWYQANVTGGTVAANVVQGKTYDPDAANTSFRFMPALAVDRNGDLAIGYTKSNSTTNPQIKFTGRLAADPVNTLTQGENTLIDGTGAQSGNCGASACLRWGDYSGMALDPNGCEFWETGEYYATTGLNHQTRIGSFHFPGCTTVGNGTLSGTVTDGSNPLVGATLLLGNRTATTNASGAYSFTVPAGTYATLTASEPGFDPGSASTLVVPDGGTLTKNFTLRAAATSGCFTDNSQSAFQRGVPSVGCDLTASPGNVILSNAPTVDQQNTAGGATGTGTTTNTAWAGQTFTAGVTGQLTKVDFQMFCNGCTSNPNLVVSIRATSAGVPTGADIVSATIAGDNSGNTATFTASFASPPTLTAGTQYALIVRTVSSPGAGGYFWIRSSPSTYAGGLRVTSANSGSTWAADSTRDGNFHTYMTTGFASSASFESSLKDANPAPNSSAHWTTLSFSATTPAGTAVKFQVAASNQSYGPFNYVGPDGTAATFFTTSGASLSQFNGFRYLRYKAYLSTSNSSVTPSLTSVAVCFQDVVTLAPTSLAVGAATGTFGGTTTLTATLTSGGNGVSGATVNFTLNGTSAGGATTNGSGVATLANVSLAGINAGSYPTGVGASFAGDAGHDVSSGTGSLTVGQADQTITVNTHAPASAAVGAHFDVAATGGNSGNPVTYSSSGSCTNVGATFTMNSAGTCTVKYDQAGNANYSAAPQVTETVNGGKADQAITVGTHAPSSATFGAGFTVAATGGASGNPVTYSSSGGCSNTGATFTMTSGTVACTVMYDQAGDANYNPAPQVTETVNASKADQAINVTGHAPTSAVFNTGFSVAANAPAGPVTFSNGGVCSNIGASFTMTSGTGTCTVKYDAAGDANYNPAPQVTESVTALKATQSISFLTPADRTYGDADFDPGATASTGFAVSYSASGDCTIVAGKVHITGAGSCTVTATQAGDANYNAAPQVQRTFSIAQASLTITANDRGKLSGQTLVLGTTAFTSSGLVGSDAVASVTLTSSGAAAAAAAGTYPIIPSAAVAAAGTDLGDYQVGYANGTLTVIKAGIVGLDSAAIKPTGALVDSFDSSLGPYGPSNKSNAADVLSNGAITLGGVTLNGSARSTQDSVLVQQGAVVHGSVRAGTTVSNKGTVTGAITANSPSAAVDAPPVAACSPFSGALPLSGTFTYNAKNGDLKVIGGNTVTIANGTYCFHNVTLLDGSVLKVNGPVTLRLTGQLDTAGGAINNTTSNPANLNIQSSFTGNAGVTLSPVGTGAYLTVYAPQAVIAIAGDGVVYGSLLGRTVKVTGATSIHVDVH